MAGELDEFLAFAQQDELSKPFDPDKPGLVDMRITGQVPDIEALARQRKAAKDAAELAEYTADIRAGLEAAGFDTEAREWRRSEPVAEDLAAAMPASVMDEHGSPLVSPERWEAYVASESEVGGLSDDQFEAFLAARDARKSEVYGADPADNESVDELYRKLAG